MAAADYQFNVKMEAVLIESWSPYPEVRSVTSPIDNADMPVETVRSWIVGTVFIASAFNTFFSPRQPAISIGTHVLQLLLAPNGLARVLPDWGVTVFST